MDAGSADIPSGGATSPSNEMPLSTTDSSSMEASVWQRGVPPLGHRSVRGHSPTCYHQQEGCSLPSSPAASPLASLGSSEVMVMEAPPAARTRDDEEDHDDEVARLASAHHHHHQKPPSAERGSDREEASPASTSTRRCTATSGGRGVKVVLEGVLSKRGNNLLKDWRERWVEVVEEASHQSHHQHRPEAREGQMRYYRGREEARGGGTGLGRVPLIGCTARPREGAATCFELVTPSGRVYAFRTRSDHERETWLQVLRPYCTSPRNAADHARPGDDHEEDEQQQQQQPQPQEEDAQGDVGERPLSLSTSPPTLGALLPQQQQQQQHGDSGGRRSTCTRHDTPASGDESSLAAGGDAESAGPSKHKRPTLDAHFKREGLLSKLGNNLRGDWRMRWFVLNTDHGTLDYYAHQGDERPKGSIGLLTAAVSAVPNRKHCFSIVTSNRSYCVTADNETDMKGWMEAIQAAHSTLLTHYQQELDGRVKEEVLIAGHLTKQGKNVLGDWRRRWCILRTDALHYYKSESDTSTHKEMGKINMLVASVKQAAVRRYSFQVITPNRTYLFQASSHEEMLEWIGKIREASEGLLNALPIDPGSSPAPPRGAGDGAGPGAGEAAALRLSSPDRPRKGAKALAELLLLPANQLCADCAEPAPRWASVTFGVFVCIVCSGIHRSLGVHLSRVRSVDLDTWDSLSTQKMVSMGNQRAKEIWEHSVPLEWAPRKPAPSDDRARKEAWVRAKYVDRLFARADHAEAASLSTPPEMLPSAGTSPRPSKEGWLTKQSNDSSWKKRWFVLRDDGLYYYKAQGEETATGILQLSSAAVRPTVAARQPHHAFEIITKNRVYLLHAESEEEMEEWVLLLVKAASHSYHASSAFTTTPALTLSEM